ncbi:hypothetical protein [Candidatus Fokinia crypta]|uniref:Transmembrane protein n=1 Tax=Candidatus Fokinia crypta TaxID=1920990 RepID=A0ABZ0UP92_9RICK|nr:hypothetical protein [Candidatus Fokinia cryptica]WPX97941.1 hypothetical protein Fokcrypt_00465 [Candidatus Fokinia cryptica]
MSNTRVFLFVIAIPMLLGIFLFRQKPINIRHEESGALEIARVGWCWRYFYFAWLVPLIRGERFSLFIGSLLLFTPCALIKDDFGKFLSFISLWYFSNLIMSFLYNKQHITRLLMNGWVLDDIPEVEEFARKKLNIRNPHIKI